MREYNKRRMIDLADTALVLEVKPFSLQSKNLENRLKAEGATAKN